MFCLMQKRSAASGGHRPRGPSVRHITDLRKFEVRVCCCASCDCNLWQESEEVCVLIITVPLCVQFQTAYPALDGQTPPHELNRSKVPRQPKLDGHTLNLAPWPQPSRPFVVAARGSSRIMN